MNDHRARLTAAVNALRVNNNSYTWFGQRHIVLPAAMASAMDGATVLRYLTNALQLRLYADFYCRGAATATVAARLTDASSYREVLSAANTGTGCAEGQWRVLAVDGDHIVIERQGLRLFVTPEELCAGPEAVPGAEVAIRLPAELPQRSPGFYLALSEEAFPLAGTDTSPMIRIYWSLTPLGAPLALRIITAALNEARIPFQFKVADALAHFGRRDAGVLYLRARHYPAVAELLSARYGQLRDTLAPGRPAFTKQLAPGLALAEDPGDGSSFGQHRCGLVAQALAQARGCTAARVTAVSEHLLAHGIDLAAPHLNPGSTDDYYPAL